MRNPFRRAAAAFVAAKTGLEPALFQVSVPPGHAAGDYAVGCFPSGKALKKDPKAVAAEVAAAFRPAGPFSAATAAGAFVNLTLDRAHLATHVLAAPAPDPDSGKGRTVVIDYSSPNIAKHLAFHHIRS